MQRAFSIPLQGDRNFLEVHRNDKKSSLSIIKVLIKIHFSCTIYSTGGVFMLAVNYSSARGNFKTYCDKANNDFETIVITRKQGGNVVMMSECEYNNMLENLYVRSNKKTYNRLMESIDQLKNGKVQAKELIE
jgi:antitoxin YefM